MIYNKDWIINRDENNQGIPTNVTVPLRHTLPETAEVWDITNVNDGGVVVGSEEVA